MVFTLSSTAISILALTILLNVSPCNCNKNSCSTNSITLTQAISFKLKDKVTGNDILSFGGSVVPVPDSIKLKDISTGFFYPLFITLGAPDVLVYSPQYVKPAHIVDTLAFFYGNATPDTLIIFTGLVDAWRGDECAVGKDAGITKVILRNQVLFETTTNDAVFTLRK